jgi:hypothetical protein
MLPANECGYQPGEEYLHFSGFTEVVGTGMKYD